MNGWLMLGITAQILFASRFIIQWIASERAGQSVMPDTFWLFSLAGSTLLLAYAIKQNDPVFIVGQASGLLVYTRNFHLIRRNKHAANH